MMNVLVLLTVTIISIRLVVHYQGALDGDHTYNPIRSVTVLWQDVGVVL